MLQLIAYDNRENLYSYLLHLQSILFYLTYSIVDEKVTGHDKQDLFL